MSKSGSYAQKVSDLQSHVSAASAKVADKEKCFPTMLIAGIVAPILVTVLLYFLQPSFVQKKEGTKYVRNGPKVFYWTVLITVVIWIAMYLFTYCSGYSGAAMLCSRK